MYLKVPCADKVRLTASDDSVFFVNLVPKPCKCKIVPMLKLIKHANEVGTLIYYLKNENDSQLK